MKDTGLSSLYIFLAEKMVKHYKNAAQQILHQQESGITIDQWVVLKYIGENDGASQIDIAQDCAKDAPTTTRIIEQLLNKGLITREQDKGDKRKHKVKVTKKGAAIIGRVLPEILLHRMNAVKGLKQAELNALVKSLNTILENLKS